MKKINFNLIWIPFIISIPVLLFFRIYQIYYLKQSSYSSFGFEKSDLTFLIVFFIIFITIIIMLSLSKNELETKKIPKNIFTCFTGILSGLLIILDNSISLIIFNYKFLFVNCTLGILSGISIILLSSVNKSSFKFWNIIPLIWSCINLIEVFIKHTTLTTEGLNILDILEIIFMTLFLLEYSKFFAGITNNNKIKNLFLWGMLFTIISIVYNSIGIIDIIKSQNNLITYEFSHNITFIAFSFYIILFLFNISNYKNDCKKS